MNTIKVLIVDDSAFMRQTIRAIIAKNARFEVVDVARHGAEAVQKVVRLSPDLVTMDVTMPTMDGIAALKEIMSIHPVPVVMLSALTQEGAHITMEALHYGAVDFFSKTELLSQRTDDHAMQEFYLKMEAAAGIRMPKLPSPAEHKHPELIKVRTLTRIHYELVFIGTSTGGPAALRKVLPKFRRDFPLPILVCQHMPKGFTSALAQSLQQSCELNVREVKDQETIEPGHIYIAPSGFQTVVESGRAGKMSFSVREGKSGQLYKPSIDMTLSSLATSYQNRVLPTIMTGMGRDGVEGCKRVKENGGYVVTEAQDSCIVYGMPKAVVEAGYSDWQIPLYQMSDHIQTIIRGA